MLKLSLKPSIKTSIKTVALVCLVMMSIYQITMLWFDYPSDRNFFYNILDSDSPITVQEAEKSYRLYYPQKAAVYSGTDNNYYQMKDVLEMQDFLEDSMDLMLYAFKQGEVINGESFDLWSEPHLLFLMPFTYTRDLLKANLDVNVNWLEGSLSFNQVYVYPARYGDDRIRLVFADDSLARQVNVDLPVDGTAKYNEMLIMQVEDLEGEDDRNYISVNQKGLTLFNEEQLLPASGELYDVWTNLHGDIYFYTGNERNVESIREYVNRFLNNPEIAWSTENTSEIRFGDLDVVISYDNEGLFSYTLLDEIEGKNTTPNHAYDVALSFMENDRLLSEIEYELEGYEVKENSIIFYYNYAYRHIPILFENLNKDYGLSYPLEVEVTGNSVVSYKRVLWKAQDIVLQGNPFEVSYQKTLDRLLDSLGTDVTVNRMYLGYYQKDKVNGANLKWIVELDGERRIYELE